VNQKVRIVAKVANCPSRRSEAIALVGASVVMLSPQVALGLSAPEVNAIAREITVRIDGQNTGSGAIVDRQGNSYTVLTNWHVVKQAGTYTVKTSDGRRYSVNSSLVRQLPGVDLAVLSFSSSHSYRVAELGNSDSLTEGMTVYVAGWADPGPVISERTYQFLTGHISSRLQKPKEGYALVYTINAAPGMSGGPVLDEKGYLVGINGRAIPDIRTGTVTFVLGIGINTYFAAINNSIPSRVSLFPTGQKFGAVDLLSRGLDKDKRGDYQGAIADYNQAILLNPNLAEAYNNRGLVFSKQGNFSGAIADYNQAIKLNPNYAAAYNNRGLVQSGQENFSGAIADYNRALLLNPQLAEAYNNRGLVFSKQGNFQDAIADYNQAIKLDPNLAAAYANRGIILSGFGDKRGAIADFQQAATLYLQQGNQANYQRLLDIIRELQR